MAFAPASLSVKRGAKMVWHNQHLVPHTVTAANRFNSGGIAPGKRWTYMASATRRHDYICITLEGLKATLGAAMRAKARL